MAQPGAAPANLMNAGHFYTNLAKPIDINLNFIVDSANGNGLGIRSLKSNGYVNNVFMHTSSTPLSNNGQLNPNPAVGYAMVSLKGNFNRYIGGFSGVIAPLSGSNLTSVVTGNPYVIVSLGTTTLAQWQAAGVPQGQVPSVGMAFIAIETSAIGGTGAVKAPGISPIMNMQIIGDPNQSIANSNSAANSGALLLIQFVNNSAAVAAPADNSIVGMTIRLDGSSVQVDGL